MFSHPGLYTPWAVQPLSVAYSPAHFAKCEMSASLLANDQVSLLSRMLAHKLTPVLMPSVCKSFLLRFAAALQQLPQPDSCSSLQQEPSCPRLAHDLSAYLS